MAQEELSEITEELRKLFYALEEQGGATLEQVASLRPLLIRARDASKNPKFKKEVERRIIKHDEAYQRILRQVENA